MIATLVILAPLVIFIATAIFEYYDRWRRLQAVLPPSYKALPFIGNIFNIPSTKPWETYASWAKELNSDLISVWAFGQLTIIINSGKAAQELLGRRSANYGDRPRIPTLELEGWTDSVTSLMPYGERWRAHRRLLHRTFNLTVVSEHRTTQVAQLGPFLRKLYATPEDVRQHVHDFTSSLALKTAYGYEVTGGHDHLSEIAFEVVERVSDTSFPGAAAVNALPFLKHLPEWFPGAEFHRHARRSHELFERLQREPYDLVKALAAQGEAPPSVLQAMLKEISSPSPSDERLMREVASMVYLASAETSFSAILTVILALALHPEVQHRAQAEIDAAIGRKRLPTYNDKDALPYVSALISESLRWNQVAPLGGPRRAINSDIYDNKLIPAGAVILWNAWATAHDPEFYPEPNEFRPERFLDDATQSALREDKAIFGYGRRECVGMHFAQDTMFLVTASMLALFEFGKTKDSAGKDVDISFDYTDSLVSHVTDFKCSILPRDADAASLLSEIADNGRDRTPQHV